MSSQSSVTQSRYCLTPACIMRRQTRLSARRRHKDRCRHSKLSMPSLQSRLLREQDTAINSSPSRQLRTERRLHRLGKVLQQITLDSSQRHVTDDRQRSGSASLAAISKRRPYKRPLVSQQVKNVCNVQDQPQNFNSALQPRISDSQRNFLDASTATESFA